MGFCYILVDKKPVVVDDIGEWTKWFEENSKNGNRVVARTENCDVIISTVFLGMNHGFDGNFPLLFETMIFGGEHDEYCERYCTYEEAEEGHKRAVMLAEGKALLNKDIEEEIDNNDKMNF